MFMEAVTLEEKIHYLIKIIKQKKEFRSLSGDFVCEQVLLVLRQQPSLQQFLQESGNLRSAQYKRIIKEVRARLRRVSALFQVEKKRDVTKLLAKLHDGQNKREMQSVIQKILESHASTWERILFYEQLYRKIFAVAGKPASLLDLGCGINPFSVTRMSIKKLNYYAYDIDEDNMQLLNSFFEWWHTQHKSFHGKAEILDISNVQNIPRLPHADLCFLFKITDILDQGKGHKKTEIILEKIPARYVVISFSTQTMSGKTMTAPRRRWMEWLCKRLGYEYKILEFNNEIFYVVKK